MNHFDRTCTVYYIVNIYTQEKYVGSTVSFSARKRHHLSELKLGKHGCERLQNAYNQYGENAFRFISLEQFKCRDEKTLYEREQYWMDTLKPEYNMNPVAGSYFNEKARSEFARKRQVASVTGRKQSQEEKEKRINSIKKFWETHPAKTISPEMRKHLSEINMGERNPNWGKTRSAESREKVSNSNSKIKVCLLSPDGVKYHVDRLAQFCREHDLNYFSTRHVAIGRRKSYMGWTKITE